MSKCKMCPAHMLAGILIIVGALNWGLVGIFQFNLVSAIFGSLPWLERTIYVLVGLAALSMLFMCKCKKCGGCCSGENCSKGGESCCQGSEHKV